MFGRQIWPKTLLLFSVLCCIGGQTTEPSFSSSFSSFSASSAHKFYVSVVMAGRNDDWQGSFIDRLRMSIHAFTSYAEEFGLTMEVLVVDYNPPPNQPSLSTASLPLFPHRDHPPWKYAEVRFVTVSNAIHQLINQQPMWSGYSAHLFEYVAKNAGLRWARGEFVLVTNPDILPGHELMRFLCARNLNSSKFYTLSRTDLRTDVPSAMLYSPIRCTPKSPNKPHSGQVGPRTWVLDFFGVRFGLVMSSAPSLRTLRCVSADDCRP
jgi:hypothetical protein